MSEKLRGINPSPELEAQLVELDRKKVRYFKEKAAEKREEAGLSEQLATSSGDTELNQQAQEARKEAEDYEDQALPANEIAQRTIDRFAADLKNCLDSLEKVDKQLWAAEKVKECLEEFWAQKTGKLTEQLLMILKIQEKLKPIYEENRSEYFALTDKLGTEEDIKIPERIYNILHSVVTTSYVIPKLFQTVKAIEVVTTAAKDSAA